MFTEKEKRGNSSHDATPARLDSAPQGLWVGALIWIGISALALALRGVRWDENFEVAQIITGHIQYPAGHPIIAYTRGAYNLQTYFSAAIFLLFENPVVLCGFRNFLFICSTVIPIYFLASLASGRVLAGHVGALLFLLGIHMQFHGTYPLFVWPGRSSNGHVGVAYALLVVAFLAAGYRRLGALLLGMVPCIHLGQLAPLLPYGFVHLCAKPRDRMALRKMLFYGAAGLAVCGLFLIVWWQYSDVPQASAPYGVEGDAQSIWSGRVAYHDEHRAIPWGNMHLLPLGTLLFGVLWLSEFSREKFPRDRVWQWLVFYTMVVTATVYGIVGVHLFLGRDIPYLFIGWLPYRLSNHLPYLLLALVLARLFTGTKQGGTIAGPAMVFGSLSLLLVRPLLSRVLDPALFTRYFTELDGIFFALFGAAVGMSLVARTRDSLFWLRVCGVIGALALFGVFHQFGAACVLLGLLVLIAGLWVERRIDIEKTRQGALLERGMIVLGVLLLSVTLWKEFQTREHLPITEFEARVVQYLDNAGEPDAMLVPHPVQVMLQAKTGHPMMTDMGTEDTASYMPNLAPTVRAMYLDLYGKDIQQQENPGWGGVWVERSAEEWRALGEKYDFRYVVSDTLVKLTIEPVVEGPVNTLYRVTSGEVR